MNEDVISAKKKYAAKGQAYYEAEHDIKNYRIFYYNADGVLTEDKTRSNVRISHPFFTELVEQTVQYILGGQEAFVTSKEPKLQKHLDDYFNKNEDFKAELTEILTDCQTKGFGYMHAYKNEENKTVFMCADSLGVIEVEARFASDKKDHTIYWYVDRIDKNNKKIKKIMVWDSKEVFFYTQEDESEIKIDETELVNPRPHILYRKDKDVLTYFKSFGYIPFFRLDNNKKQFSSLKPIKDIIDDYDIMSCSLSNNLIDFDTPIHVVKGFEGDNLDELQQNLKTKKIIGMEATDSGAGVDVMTVDIPFEARKAKLELDEKNIYRFGMGLNTAGLKDTSATTNIAIKAAYSLLDLKCSKLKIKLKQFLRKILRVVIDEINTTYDTDYQINQVEFEFKPEIMSNAQENAQIELTKAQEQQARITTLLNLASQLDSETLMKLICDVLDIDYEEIKNKLPKDEELDVDEAIKILESEVI